MRPLGPGGQESVGRQQRARARRKDRACSARRTAASLINGLVSVSLVFSQVQAHSPAGAQRDSSRDVMRTSHISSHITHTQTCICLIFFVIWDCFVSSKNIYLSYWINVTWLGAFQSMTSINKKSNSSLCFICIHAVLHTDGRTARRDERRTRHVTSHCQSSCTCKKSKLARSLTAKPTGAVNETTAPPGAPLSCCKRS
jgi:hypothetical protein